MSPNRKPEPGARWRISAGRARPLAGTPGERSVGGAPARAGGGPAEPALLQSANEYTPPAAQCSAVHERGEGGEAQDAERVYPHRRTQERRTNDYANLSVTRHISTPDRPARAAGDRTPPRDRPYPRLPPTFFPLAPGRSHPIRARSRFGRYRPFSRFEPPSRPRASGSSRDGHLPPSRSGRKSSSGSVGRSWCPPTGCTVVRGADARGSGR